MGESRAQGIGGVFFRAADPAALAAWYAEHLGLQVEEWGGSVLSADAGDVTVWSPFPEDTGYWPAGQQAMVNYRVRVVETYPSERRPDRGTVITENEVLNQDGVVVMTMRGRGHFRRRP